jgi:lipoyl(octanoyl) transferase
MRNCRVCALGRIGYGEALDLQRRLAEARKRGEAEDHLLLLEHPHVITLGRNGQMSNVLAGESVLDRAGIEFHAIDRGGDVTYHGPGQLVGYPVFDLREWKRDVGAFVRGIEQALIDTLAEYDIEAGRIPKLTGVWVGGAKVAAIGVHLSRWVSTHGFALNVNTDLSYFQYIVPCGLSKPVTSMQKLGVCASLEEVSSKVAAHFGRIFEFEIRWGLVDLPAPESEN